MENFKVLIGIPMMDAMLQEPVMSLINLRDGAKYNNAILLKGSTYIHTARNQLVYNAVDAGATHLMFIDSDMQYTANDFNKLMDTAIQKDLDIIGGLYVSRYNPKQNIVKKIVYQDGFRQMVDLNDLPTTTEPFEVDAIGTGFMLINMRVFKELEPPFFFYTEPMTFGLKTVRFPNNEVGEDVSFCLYAKENGFKVWCDPTLEIGHVGRKVYKHEMFPEFKPQGVME